MAIRKKTLNILGTRGIPARHGGFETFAEHLAVHLVERGWRVRVYCQSGKDKTNPSSSFHDEWSGIERIHIRTRYAGALGTMEFDLKCVLDVVKRDGIDLVLGYNTAIFNIIQRLCGRTVLMNMDGIEWRREKWSLPAKSWLYCNELIGANVCTIAIADNPHIATHVSARSFKSPVMIPYGADEIGMPEATVLHDFELKPDQFFISIARIEPENSILEMVQSFSDAQTNLKLVVLGNLTDELPYHRRVRKAANQNVIFVGAVYDQKIVGALRYFARAHLHGHQVGGTNPSLVEALAAGSAVIAHNNSYNRWTTGNQQFYFTDNNECTGYIDFLSTPSEALKRARLAASARHKKHFTWEQVLDQYEVLLEAEINETYPRFSPR